MQDMEIMDIFKKSGAYKQGHFKLSSGLHSGAYLQCALVLQEPVIAARLCSALAEKFRADAPDVIVGPAMGGVIFAYELARALNARAVFTERDDEGKMALRRGFEVGPKNKVLIAEDVLTTGKSVKEVLRLLEEYKVKPIAITSLVDRAAEKIDFRGIRTESLVKVNVPVFDPSSCPLCQEGMEIDKPGSRKL